MDPINNKIHQILAHLAEAAATAADAATDAVHSAGTAVSDKYDVLKLNIELSRLQEEQKKLFSDIGRTMYLIQAGALATASENGAIDAQQTVDRLLLMADQKQQDIDLVSERLKKLNGSKVCIVCGKVCPALDTYCAVCGAKLPG